MTSAKAGRYAQAPLRLGPGSEQPVSLPTSAWGNGWRQAYGLSWHQHAASRMNRARVSVSARRLCAPRQKRRPAGTPVTARGRPGVGPVRRAPQVYARPRPKKPAAGRQVRAIDAIAPSVGPLRCASTGWLGASRRPIDRRAELGRWPRAGPPIGSGAAQPRAPGVAPAYRLAAWVQPGAGELLTTHSRGARSAALPDRSLRPSRQPSLCRCAARPSEHHEWRRWGAASRLSLSWLHAATGSGGRRRPLGIALRQRRLPGRFAGKVEGTHAFGLRSCWGAWPPRRGQSEQAGDCMWWPNAGVLSLVGPKASRKEPESLWDGEEASSQCRARSSPRNRVPFRRQQHRPNERRQEASGSRRRLHSGKLRRQAWATGPGGATRHGCRGSGQG